MSNDLNDAVRRVREALDDVVAEAGGLSDEARADVEAAIDDLEERIDALRDEQ